MTFSDSQQQSFRKNIKRFLKKSNSQERDRQTDREREKEKERKLITNSTDAILQIKEQLEEVMSSTGAYQRYRQTIHSLDPPAIPYLGTHTHIII
jgi:hypothetical protein